MSAFALMVVLTVIGAVGVVLMVSGWMQPAPSLSRTIEHLRRPGSASAESAASPGANRLLDPVVRVVSNQPRLRPKSTELELAGRSVEQHALYMVVAALLGLVIPPVVLGALQAADLISLQAYVPVIVALGAAVLGPVIVHTTLVEQADETRASTFAIRSRRISTSSRCCWPATPATKPPSSRPRTPATAACSSNCDAACASRAPVARA